MMLEVGLHWQPRRASSDQHTQINGIPRQYLSTLGTRDGNQTYLTNSVANPFSGLQTSQNTAATTPFSFWRVSRVSGGRRARPAGTAGRRAGAEPQRRPLLFPERQHPPAKRASHGLTFVFNYIYSRLMEQVTWLNDSDPVPEKRVASIDHPQRYVTGPLPTNCHRQGKALDFHSHLGNSLIGGLAADNVYTFQVGGPLLWVNGSSSSPGDYVLFGGGPMNLNNRQVNGPRSHGAIRRQVGRRLNYHLRTFSTTFANAARRRHQPVGPVPSALRIQRRRRPCRFAMEAYNVLNQPVSRTQHHRPKQSALSGL